MFCPSCGFEDSQSNQFCRACGANLNFIRNALAKPDNITQSAVSAREEIGRAVAAKIRETENAYELKKVAEDVLPEIEKFLESPEEKRLRRIRIGTIVSSVGIGVTLLLFLMTLHEKEGYFMVAAGLIPFFIGLGLILNGLFFTVPKKMLSDNFVEAEKQRELDTKFASSEKSLNAVANELSLPEPQNLFSSVTENTTTHLKDKIPVERR